MRVIVIKILGLKGRYYYGIGLGCAKPNIINNPAI